MILDHTALQNYQFITKKRYFGTFSIRNQYDQRDLNFDMIFCIIITHYHSLSSTKTYVFPSIYRVFLFWGGGVVSVSLSSHFPGFVRPSGPSEAQTLAVGFPTYPHRGGSCWKKGHQTQVGGKWGSWWLKPTPFEKYARQHGFIFPRDRDESKKSLSCHHLDI